MPKRTPSTATAASAEPSESRIFKRVHAVRHGHNDVELVEETYEAAPKMTRTLFRGPTSSAQYHTRVWLETWLGPDRYGDSGL